MSPDLQECENQVMSLPVNDRATLANRLIASLDVLTDSENEQLWLSEAERRYQEYKNGSISARPAVNVLRDARLSIK